ncbi:MAG: hypothetical protein LBS21_15490 [Clostridiales bacterium]|jgi:hypothetical protein|nr:hypothetical protein [Clostridiales bacterium]
MKRRLITNQFEKLNYIPANIPEGLKDYAGRLRLLNDIPLTYLLSDISDLSEESMRFFIVDINWTDALVDGAFSIGRVCARDSAADSCAINSANESRSYFDTPRLKRMHPNHKSSLMKNMPDTAANEDYKLISGFIMRSQMVRVMKGLLLYGYDKNGAPKSNMDDGSPLNILRMEAITDDILICLFHGLVYEILIAEPKTGLRFGVSAVDESGANFSRSIDLRSAIDSDDFGKRIESFCIDSYTDENGRLHACKLAEAVGNELLSKNKLGADKITPSRFAFEMIAVAHRAKFRSGT